MTLVGPLLASWAGDHSESKTSLWMRIIGAPGPETLGSAGMASNSQEALKDEFSLGSSELWWRKGDHSKT